MYESIWHRARSDWWQSVESPGGRTVELIATVALSLIAVGLYPDDSGPALQAALQGGVIVVGLVVLGVGFLLGIFVYEAPRALLLESRKRETLMREVLPLTIEGIDVDQSWRRLIIRNPNHHPVIGVYVRVFTHGGFLPVGWNFTWSTLETGDPVQAIDIPAGRTRVLDVCALVVSQSQSHVVEAEIFQRDFSRQFQLAAARRLPPGTHSADIEICAPGTVPSAEYRLTIDVAEVDVVVRASPR